MRRVAPDKHLYMMHGDATYSIPSGSNMQEFAFWLAEKPDEAYLSAFRAGIIDAAVAAADGLRDAELAWTSADARGVGGNRHAKDGVCDPEVGPVEGDTLTG